MNKNIVVIVVLGVGVAVCHPPSEVYAGQSVPAQAVAQVPPSLDDPAWNAWRADFEAMLEADQKYTAADNAAESYVGDDADEYGRLVAARDARYRELAQIVYTQYFGEWAGDAAGFDELVTRALSRCAKEAVEVCKGKVCWVMHLPCRYACQDGAGNCGPMPVQ